MNNSLDSLQAISPIDGRYRADTQILSKYFSEAALIRYRIQVEIEYFLALAREPKFSSLRRLTAKEEATLVALYEEFDLTAARQVKKIEATTHHDVKAVEYYIKQRLQSSTLQPYLELIHFGLTSEDVNNLAHNVLMRDALQQVYLPTVQELIRWLQQQSRQYKKLALLSLTHGQPATPTTLGKEFMVFAQRLQRQYLKLKSIQLLGKCGGATGTWGAHLAAYPEINWMQFTKKFVRSLRLEANLATTQIESHDCLVEVYQTITRINSIVKDLDQDMWLYISRRIFVQRNIAGEIGSSAMPHKINPIYFENSEGNCGISSAYFNHLSTSLPVSRLQRDLTDSTVLRNQGVALAHALLALRNTVKALSRVHPNKEHIAAELNQHWEVLAEPIQTVMRRYGKNAPYEQLKELTRGQNSTAEQMKDFIDQLDLPDSAKIELKKLTPATYTGLAEDVALLKL